MTPEEFGQLLSQGRYLVFDIPRKDCRELETKFACRTYTSGRLTIKMATRMHAGVADWAARFIEAGVQDGAFKRDALFLLSEGCEKGLINPGGRNSGIPNMSIVPGERYRPTVVFKFGYAEPYDDLKMDVKTLLEGSRGEITKAILIKVEPFGPGETEIRAGFVEKWHLVGGVAKRDGGRETLLPPPANRATQRLTLNLGEILGDKFGNFASNGWAEDSNISIYLDPLRSAIERGARHYRATSDDV